MNKKVFVNRILNMKKIKLIGIDMDHTLVRYKTRNFEELVFNLAIDVLIKEKNYPERIKQIQFNFDEAIRGLVIDSKNGNILKLSRFGAIRDSYHGTQKIDFAEQKQIYRSVYVDLNDPNYLVIDTSFSISLCVLYAQLVNLKDAHFKEFPNYNNIAADVLSAVDLVHANGSLKACITQNIEHYVLQDARLVTGLKRLLLHGKKLFILTNSEYFYTNILLKHTINPYLNEHESWQDLFEYVITAANKPRFFYDTFRFLKVNPVTGEMTNLNGKIIPGLYQGGCAKKFTADLTINGDEILYIGDHIYDDILRLKKDCNWRTALVVEELGSEINSHRKSLLVEKKIAAAMTQKIDLEKQYTDLNTQVIETQAKNTFTKQITSLQQQVATLDGKISQLLQEEQAFYNQKWGRIFRTGAEESYFAYQVERYACIYMEKLVDLLNESPLSYFRAERRPLPHDRLE